LLVTIALAAWWLSSSLGPVQSEADKNGVSQESTYQEAVNSAKEVAGVMEDRDNKLPETTGPGKSIAVYDGISVPDNTTVLDLSGRRLSGSLKAEIRHLTNLRELNISDNDFTSLPAEVGQLSKLETLNLSNNPFTGLPQELGNLSNLKVLDVRGTQYSQFDMDIIKAKLPASTQVLTDS